MQNTILFPKAHELPIMFIIQNRLYGQYQTNEALADFVAIGYILYVIAL